MALFQTWLDEYRKDPAACKSGPWVDAGFAQAWFESASKYDLNRTVLPITLAAMRLGEVGMVFHPAEMYSCYGLRSAAIHRWPTRSWSATPTARSGTGGFERLQGGRVCGRRGAQNPRLSTAGPHRNPDPGGVGPRAARQSGGVAASHDSPRFRGFYCSTSARGTSRCSANERLPASSTAMTSTSSSIGTLSFPLRTNSKNLSIRYQ